MIIPTTVKEGGLVSCSIKFWLNDSRPFCGWLTVNVQPPAQRGVADSTRRFTHPSRLLLELQTFEICNAQSLISETRTLHQDGTAVCDGLKGNIISDESCIGRVWTKGSGKGD